MTTQELHTEEETRNAIGSETSGSRMIDDDELEAASGGKVSFRRYTGKTNVVGGGRANANNNVDKNTIVGKGRASAKNNASKNSIFKKM